jgi:hypothetical protein
MACLEGPGSDREIELAGLITLLILRSFRLPGRDFVHPQSAQYVAVHNPNDNGENLEIQG